MKYLLTILVLVASLAQAEVYKSINEKGEIVYTDQPTPGAERIRLPELPTYTPPPVHMKRPAPLPKAEPAVQEWYERIGFVKPDDGSTIRDNLGIIEIEIELQPALLTRLNHKLQFYFDNVPYGPPLDTNGITISNVARGTHSLSAGVVDADGLKLLQTDTITVFVKRESILQDEEPGIGDDGTPSSNLRTLNPNVRTLNPNVRSPNPNIISPPPVPAPR